MVCMSNSQILENFLSERRADDGLRSQISTLSSEAILSLEKLVIATSPSANTIREYLRLVSECALRDGKDVCCYLDDVQVGEILNQKLSKKEKQKLLRQFFETQRFPQREKLQNDAAQFQKELTRKYGFEIKIPEELEGSKLEFTFTSQSLSEMQTWAKKVQALNDDPALSNLYSLLLGDFKE